MQIYDRHCPLHETIWGSAVSPPKFAARALFGNLRLRLHLLAQQMTDPVVDKSTSVGHNKRVPIGHR